MIASALVAAGTLVAWPESGQPAAAAGAVVLVRRQPAGFADLVIGFDHTHTSHLAAGAGGAPAAVRSAGALLRALRAPQNVHLMGFGAGDPEPVPGRYAWSSLDARVRVMGRTVPASRRMITLCTAPGWMKGSGDWNMDAAVTRSHYADFAELAAKAAERYDGRHRDAAGRRLPKVTRFDVWNELKGFWNNYRDRWDYEGYTAMYNKVYAAIKQVRPAAEVGGPYAPFGPSPYSPSRVGGPYGTIDQRTLDAVRYWLRHKRGADFISVDGGPQNQQGVVTTGGFTAGRMFADVARWIRGLDATRYPGAHRLPISWVEFYPGIGRATGRKAIAIDIANAVRAGRAGIGGVYLWEPEGDAAGDSEDTGKSVWTDTSRPAGGRPTAFYSALEKVREVVPPGTRLRRVRVSGPIVAIANRDTVLLISKSPAAMTVHVNESSVTIGAYAVTTVRYREG